MNLHRGSYMAEHRHWSIFSMKFGKKCICFAGFWKTRGLLDNKYFGGRNTARFQSYGHWYCLNGGVTLFQGLNNVLVPKSDL